MSDKFRNSACRNEQGKTLVSLTRPFQQERLAHEKKGSRQDCFHKRKCYEVHPLRLLNSWEATFHQRNNMLKP